MAKGITSKGKPRLGGGPIKRDSGDSVRPTTATPGRKPRAARVSGKGPQKGTPKLRPGPITRGRGGK